MSQSSPTLTLPYLQPSQAQKHVTHNEALRILDAITQLTVLEATLTDPPSAPTEGDRYIIPPGPSGAWAGHGGAITVFADGLWQFFAPSQGWRADVIPTGQSLRFDGAVWVPALPERQNLPEIGVNTTADGTNRLAVASEATLLTHDGDDHQLKINKSAAADTASLLFQTGFSGRAEMGTAGADDFAIKVSPDGSTWHSAALVDKDDGTMAVQGLASIRANSAAVSSVLFTPGGDGTVSIYRMNTTSSAPSRTAAIASISADTITLTTYDATLFIENIMEGVSYIRVWNTSKPTPESAWVKATPAGNQLQVTDAADISGWSGADTIQVGDPAGQGFGNNYIALDLSPMQINLFGQAFLQTGIICKAGLYGGTAGDSISVTPTGLGGSFITCAQEDANVGTTLIPTTTQSPISNSNLIGLRENISTTAGTRLVSVMAMLV